MPKDKYTVPLPKDQQINQLLYGGASSHQLRNRSVLTHKVQPEAVSTAYILQVNDESGASTTNYQQFEDIPGFSIQITLEEKALVYVVMRVSGFLYDNTTPHTDAKRLKGFYYLAKNGERVRGQALEVAKVVAEGPGALHRSFWSSAVVVHGEELPAGVHEFKGQFKVDDTVTDTVVFAYHRELAAIILKR